MENEQIKKKGKKITVRVIYEESSNSLETEINIKVSNKKIETEIVEVSDKEEETVVEVVGALDKETTQETMENVDEEKDTNLKKEKLEVSNKEVEKKLDKDDIILYCQNQEEFTAKQLRDHFNATEKKEVVRINNIINKNCGKLWERIGKGEYKVIKEEEKENNEEEKIP